MTGDQTNELREDLHGLEVRVTRTETQLDTHVRACGEHSRRMVESLEGARKEMVSIREALTAGLGRVHGRINRIVVTAWGLLTAGMVSVIAYLVVHGRPWD